VVIHVHLTNTQLSTLVLWFLQCDHKSNSLLAHAIHAHLFYQLAITQYDQQSYDMLFRLWNHTWPLKENKIWFLPETELFALGTDKGTFFPCLSCRKHIYVIEILDHQHLKEPSAYQPTKTQSEALFENWSKCYSLHIIISGLDAIAHTMDNHFISIFVSW